MKRLKVSRVTCTTAILLCSAAWSVVPMMAQDAGVPPASREGRMGNGRGGGQQQMLDRVTKELNLTPDQVTQVKAISADQMKKMMALREDTSTPQEEKRPKMMAIREESQTKIKALLTEEQKPKYDAMVARMRERMRNQDGQSGPAPPQ